MDEEIDSKNTSALSFPDDSKVQNIELGAGCGDFGKQFYSLCYLTDIPKSTDKCPCNYIDHYCKATDLPWDADRFEMVIMCNPFGYGFMTKDSTEALLNSVFRVLKANGKVLIISSNANQWCNTERIEERFTDYNNTHDLK